MKIPTATEVLAPVPGICLCMTVCGGASLLQFVEVQMLGRAWLESLVLAILLGTAIRSFWQPERYWNKGIKFTAKTLLEIAIVLLGASLSFGSILAVGPNLVIAILAIVAIAIVISYGLGRSMGLPPRMAVLIACGNSICGNSAIAAVAPVIGAEADDVATAIAFTAVLGVAVVLLLPMLILLGLSVSQYGVIAGLTVYAVPQVLAATAPVSAVSVQLGTLVKLIRVLMLGPVVFALSLIFKPVTLSAEASQRKGPSLRHLIPWFIVGFLFMSVLRSLHLIPGASLPWLAAIAGYLTTLSMAALGLGVDVRKVTAAGPKVIATVTLSLLALTVISLVFVRLLLI